MLDNSPGKQLFDSINTWEALMDLISEGTCEDLYLECKSQEQPKIERGTKTQLGEAASAFSNTNGGVMIFGMSTTRNSHSGNDVLTQIEPIGSIKDFESSLKNKLPALTAPAIINFETKILKEKSQDKRGVLVLYIPKLSQPVLALETHTFFFRSADENIKAPYDTIRSLFAAADVPHAQPTLSLDRITKDEGGFYLIPISIENSSLASAHDALIMAEVLNPEAVESVTSADLHDHGNVNQGRNVWGLTFKTPIYFGLGQYAGTLQIKMKPRHYHLKLRCRVFSSKMVANEMELTIYLGRSIRITSQKVHPIDHY